MPLLCALALVLGARAAEVSAAAAETALDARLQATLEQAVEELGVPGASAAAVERGSLVWSGVAGVRTIGGPAVTPSTQFVTASVAKSFTAAMVLRLAEEGELSLGDRVSRYVPGLPGGRRIRIENLLSHSSGLRDYLYSREINETFAAEPDHVWTRDEVLAAITGPLKFRPGRHHRYSNSNYIVLGAVIERVTGASIQQTFERLIAGPLGLTDSSWLYDPSLFDRGAHPYIERAGGAPVDQWRQGFVTTDYIGEVWTDGGLATTGTDLARFGNALVAGSLLEPRTRREMLRFRGPTGLGVFRYGFDGRGIVGHDGVYGGFTAQQYTIRGTGLTIAVLTNLEARFDPSWAIWKRLARTALPGLRR